MDADRLYRLEPTAFTAARDELARAARAAGDKEGAAALRALRRPSVAAWLVNRLADEQGDLLDQLLALGPELAKAQSGGDAAALRALGAQRRELVEAVADAAVGRAGRPVSAAVREEVASTLEAALADPHSAEAVRSGRLVRALSYAGFGAVDLSGAVAAAPATTRAAGREAVTTRAAAAAARSARVAAAETAALAAAGRLDDTVRACEQAQRERAAAAQAADAADAELDRLTEALTRARQARDRAAHDARSAAQAADRALTGVRHAQQAAETARAELDRVRRG